MRLLIAILVPGCGAGAGAGSGSAADVSWRASNLIDGFPVIREEEHVSRRWQAEGPGPHHVVLGFRGDQQAKIAAIVIELAKDGDRVGSRIVSAGGES